VLASGDPSLHETDDNRQHNLLQSSFYDMFLLARVDAYEKSIQINAKRVEGNLFTTKIMPDKIYSINVFSDTLPGETFFEKFEEQLALEKEMEDCKGEEVVKEKNLAELKDKLEALDGEETEVERKKLELELKQAELELLEHNEKTSKMTERLETLRTELFEAEEPDLEDMDEEMEDMEEQPETTEVVVGEPAEAVEDTEEAANAEAEKEGDETAAEETTETPTDQEEKANDDAAKTAETSVDEDVTEDAEAPVDDDVVVEENEESPVTVVVTEETTETVGDAAEADDDADIIVEETPQEEEAADVEVVEEEVEATEEEKPAEEEDVEMEDKEAEKEETDETKKDESVIDLTEEAENAEPDKMLCRILIGLKEPLGEVRTTLQGCKEATPKTYCILLEADLPEGQRFLKVKKFLDKFMKGSYEKDQVNKEKWGKKKKTATVAAKLLKEAMKRRRLDFEVLTCPNNCGMQLKAYEMLDHEKRECKNRIVTCKFCDLKLKHCEMAEHKSTCKLAILRCVNNCGKSVARKDMEDHLQTTCLNQRIECEYAAFGCKQKEKRKNKMHHMQQKDVQHLAMVRKAHEKLQAKYDKLLDFLKTKFDDLPEFDEPEPEEEEKPEKEPVEQNCIVIED